MFLINLNIIVIQRPSVVVLFANFFLVLVFNNTLPIHNGNVGSEEILHIRVS